MKVFSRESQRLSRSSCFLQYSLPSTCPFLLLLQEVFLSTNKQIKAWPELTLTVSSGAYLYGLDGKDITVLRFYLDRPIFGIVR